MQSHKIILMLIVLLLDSCDKVQDTISTATIEATFYKNEWAFDSICHILLRSRYGEQFPYDERYFDKMPQEDVHWEKIKYLSPQDKNRMDSLYSIVQCEKIYFQGTELVEETGESLQERKVRFIYSSGGWFGNGIHKEIVYMPVFPLYATLVSCNIDSLVTAEDKNDNQKLISYYKKLKDNWYINVSAYK